MTIDHPTFSGKTAIITGGGTGIGRAIAAKLLAQGANVVLNGRREKVLQSTAKELDPSGERIRFVAGSISESETSERLVRTATEAFGGVDLLVNNAGVFRPTAFEEHTDEDLDWFLGTILSGTFYASRAVVPALRKRGGGAIVNVGSMWAEHAVNATPSSAYSAAKAGVHALTRNLALELAKDKIRVNSVAPAVVETPVYETFIPKEDVAGALAGFHDFHPLGRNATADEVADLILYLASDKAAFVTGTIVPIDGGVLAGR